MDSWKGGENQYIQSGKVLNCTLPTNNKEIPTFPIVVGQVIETDLRGWRPAQGRIQLLCKVGVTSSKVGVHIE